VIDVLPPTCKPFLTKKSLLIAMSSLSLRLNYNVIYNTN
jgi:hypothetical protein